MAMFLDIQEGEWVGRFSTVTEGSRANQPPPGEERTTAFRSTWPDV
jgi:hypothetical protein